VPAEAWFVLGAVSMYVGSALAVTAFDRMDVVAVAWLRVVGAALALCLWRRPWRTSVTARWLALAAAFGLVTTAMNTAFYMAIDHLPLGTAVAIEFLGPVAVVAALSRTGRNLVALALAGAGVVLVSGAQWQGNAVGVAWALTSAALWAGYILFGSRVAAGGSGLEGLAIGLAVGALVMAPLAAPHAGPAFASAGLLAVCLGVGVLSNAIPYGLDQMVLRRVSADRFALLLSILPVTAAIVGAVALGQKPSAAEVVGIAAVVAALAIRERSGEGQPADLQAGRGDAAAAGG
jgi:inner membrane transporter RhtA